jgi:hypothetical protein
MKKTLLALLFITVAAAIAAPTKFASAVSCLWTDNGTTLFANNARSFGSFSYLSDGDPSDLRMTLDVVDSPDWLAGTGAMADSVNAGDNWQSRIFLYGFAGDNYSEAILSAGSGVGASLSLSDNYGFALLSPLYGVQAGGTEAWKLGSVVPATVQLVTDKYVQVEIGGQVVKLAVVE